MMKTEGFFSPEILKHRVSVVTGAGRGLGKALALALARAGSAVALVARTQAQIHGTAEEIMGRGGTALPIQGDVTRANDISSVVHKVLSEFGRIDVLVNNAGQNASYVHHKAEDVPESEWMEMMRINVTSVFLVSQIVGRSMLARGSGKIINIASSFGMKPVPGRLCYSVTKAAVIQMTRGLALEWADRGVTVNCIAPGSIDLFPDSTDEGYVRMNEERRKRIPLGRLGAPEELGPLLVFLASDASNYMTGETIFFDGGMVVR